MRRFAVLLVLMVSLAAAPASAQTGGPIIEKAATALKADPLYVDADAEAAISDSEADAVRTKIEASGVPLFIAILPAAAAAEVGGDASDVVVALEDATALAGNYAAAVGRTFRAEPSVGGAATAAVQAERDRGLAAILTSFVDLVASAEAGGSPSPGGGVAVGQQEDDGSGGGSNLGLFAVLGLGGAGLFMWSRNKRRRVAEETARAEAADREMLQAELSVLADDVMRLEPQVSINPDAREDYDAAVNRYRAAAAALEYADEPVDLVRVDRVVQEARYAMDRARARIDGREPPPPPESLRQPGRHNEPPLETDERGRPVYAGYDQPFYGGGWFGGGGGGLFTGLLLGQMLGGFGGWGGGWDGGHDDGGDSGGDGGGWGGGDFGGGDFGGGDFGGGDF